MKYNIQDLSALSIKTQCDCIQVALAQIQSALLGNQQAASRMMCDDSFSGQRLVSVLGACEITFAILVSRLAVFNGSLKGENGMFSRRSKLERLWNESDIVEVGHNISRLSDGLNLLLTALNTYGLSCRLFTVNNYVC